MRAPQHLLQHVRGCVHHVHAAAVVCDGQRRAARVDGHLRDGVVLAARPQREGPEGADQNAARGGGARRDGAAVGRALAACGAAATALVPRSNAALQSKHTGSRHIFKGEDG